MTPKLAKATRHERRNLARDFKKLYKAFVAKYAAYTPRYVASKNPLKFRGARIDLARLQRITNVLSRDLELQNNPFGTGLLEIGDGSGTQVFRPQVQDTGAKVFCFWKRQNQLRWYIFVDASGRIDFISSSYFGKIDDTTILEPSMFYE